MEHGGVNSKAPRREKAVVRGVVDRAIRVHFDVADNKPRDGFATNARREIGTGFRYLSFAGPSTNFTGNPTNRALSSQCRI